MKNNIKILFIGNSHTYYNNMPKMVKDLFAGAGVAAQVVMETEGGKGLLYHCDRKDAIFNIIHGGFDYVVLQDIAKTFNRANLIEGGLKIKQNALVKSDAHPVLYMIWAHRENPAIQAEITASYAELAGLLGADLAPAGEVWHKMLKSRSAPQFYREDGNHATPLGSYLAACCIFYAISRRERPLRITDGLEPHTSLGLDTGLCRKIHSEACRITKKYSLNSKQDD